MTKRPGHNPGHAEPLATFTWDEYVASLVDAHGSLAAVAQKLVQARGGVDDAQSVERGLRRLRTRGQHEGGDYGRRLLATFGVPRDVESRVRWMGQYHSRFTDLPRSLCGEQLRLWDRPPVSESRARIWLQLGYATLALRGRAPEEAELHVKQARAAAAHASPSARVELALVEAYCASLREERARVRALLEEAGALLETVDTGEDDRACLHARWVDQLAFQLNNPPPGQEADPRGALALYERIAVEAPPFARCRRENGLAFARWRLGEREAALAHAEAASRAAGDGGSLRLRVMALKMLGRIQGGEEGERTRQRAAAIARHLEDEELLFRTRPRR